MKATMHFDRDEKRLRFGTAPAGYRYATAYFSTEGPHANKWVIVKADQDEFTRLLAPFTADFMPTTESELNQAMHDLFDVEY